MLAAAAAAVGMWRLDRIRCLGGRAQEPTASSSAMSACSTRGARSSPNSATSPKWAGSSATEMHGQGMAGEACRAVLNGRRPISTRRRSGRSSLRPTSRRCNWRTKLGFERDQRDALSRRPDARTAAPGLGLTYQPPPPPPPPPPPDDPPPPDPLLDPGAVEAELIVLDSDEPTVSAKLVGLLHGLLDPEYQAKPCWPWAAAAASTPAKRSAQRFSTPSAIA